MTKERLRVFMSFLLIGTKLTIIFWIFFLGITKTFDFTTCTALIAMILPLFTIHTTIAARGLFQEKTNPQDKLAVSNSIMIFSLAVPILYFFYLMLLVSLTPDRVSSEEQKIFIGFSEGIFGVYMGFIIKFLYQESIQGNQATPA
jgi:hypothetical protein